MSYDLAVWVGARPQSDSDASAVYERLMDRMEAGDAEAEPSPAIRAYVAALLERWPDITEDAGEDSPWADGPLIGNAFEDLVAAHLADKTLVAAHDRSGHADERLLALDRAVAPPLPWSTSHDAP